MLAVSKFVGGTAARRLLSSKQTQLAHEPHKIKTVRLTRLGKQLSLQERKRNLIDVDFNVYHLTPSQVSFDMSSVGTGAVSQEQLARQYVGDEAYAGARSFYRLQQAASRVLGHTFVCPTHNRLGAVKLIVASSMPSPADEVVPINGAHRLSDALAARGVRVVDVCQASSAFSGDVDVDKLAALLDAQRVSHVLVECYADGVRPVSLGNLRDVRSLLDRRGVKLVLDCSLIAENACYVQRHEPGCRHRRVAALVRDMSKTAHVAIIDGGYGPRSATGGLLLTDNPADHQRYIEQVVVYEGLHTYGGMSGRTMEVLAQGLDEMVDEAQAQWIHHQATLLADRLRVAGVPLLPAADGAHIDASQLWPGSSASCQAHALAAALYQSSGVRAAPTGARHRDELLAVQIPRLALTSRQVSLVADAVAQVWQQREAVAPLSPVTDSAWHDGVRFRASFADLADFDWGDVTPYTVHTFERVGHAAVEQRQRLAAEAGWNTFLIRSEDVTIDLLTDSGTSAMSTQQWAAYDAAQSTPCISDAYRCFVRTMQVAYGFRHVIPTHQGRAAEHVLSQVMIRPGQIVPGNMYFTTTREHQELAGGVFVDVIVDQAHDAQSNHPWKGNIDVDKLKALVREHGPARIAYIKYEFSVNMAGGQPCSMANIREVSAYCRAQGIPVCFDATRAVENAYMIQKNDAEFHHVPVRHILREMMMYGDACSVSGKKDYLVNIGGMVGFREDGQLAQAAEQLLRVFEGGVGDGGLGVGDLAAMAQGVEEMLDDQYIRSRVEQTALLGQLLADAGVPIVQPAGTFAIFIDARKFLPHVDQDEFPAQRLAAELYIETGVRAMERGNVSKGRDPVTGKNCRPALELVRLTIPRRVYTDDHIREVANGVIRLWQKRAQIGGLAFVYEPKHLRFFQSRFAPVEPHPATGSSADEQH